MSHAKNKKLNVDGQDMSGYVIIAGRMHEPFETNGADKKTRQASDDMDGRHEQISWKPMDQNNKEQKTGRNTYDVNIIR